VGTDGSKKWRIVYCREVMQGITITEETSVSRVGGMEDGLVVVIVVVVMYSIVV
jgi:hypothetical protein